LGIQCFCRLEDAHPATKCLELSNQGLPSKLRMLLVDESTDTLPLALSQSLLVLPSPEGVLFGAVAGDEELLFLLCSTSFTSACSQKPRSVAVNHARPATLLARFGLHLLMGVCPRGRQHTEAVPTFVALSSLAWVCACAWVLLHTVLASLKLVSSVHRRAASAFAGLFFRP